MSARAPWDWPPEGNWPPTIEYTRVRRGVYAPRRQQRPIGFLGSLMIVTVAAVMVLRFAWAPLLMLAVLFGIDSPSRMLGAFVGLLVLGAVVLRERLSGH
jgi:hypothetical protein